MAQLTMLPMVLLLISHTLADIIVQPGYEQPHSTQKQPSTQPIVQPSETLSHENVENHDESQYVDPGYHLELHPVYSNAYDIPAQALTPINQQTFIPPMSRAAYRRLVSSNAVPAPYYYQYLPAPVHSRVRRSNVEKRDSATQRGETDKHDVAKKSSLSDSSISVSDSQSQKEKRVNPRQSVPGTLLGLNPANMYPADQEYTSNQLNPVLNANQEIANQQTTSQINSREATRLQQRQETSGLRNAPDPRPISASAKSANFVDVSSGSFSESQIVNDQDTLRSRHNAVTNIEITGPPLHSHSHWHGHTHANGHTHSHVHSHSHGKWKNADTRPEETYANAAPTPFANNELRPNNLDSPQASSTPVVPVYQLAPVQGTNYAPSAQYFIVPQPRPVDYVNNYVWSYPAPAVSYRICFVTPYNSPSIIYQLA